MKRLCVVLSILLVCALIFVGCPNGEETTTPPPPDETTTPPPDETTTPPPSGPQYGGTLRVILSGEATSMFPPEQIGPEDFYATAPAIELMLYMDTEGMYHPFLAESYEEDPDNLASYFYLREGIKFQDGTDFNAEAVKWNIEQLRDSPYTGPSFATVSSVEAVDEYTVKVNFSEWDNLFEGSMAYFGIVSPTAYEEHGIDWMRLNPVGTGPFELVSYQRDQYKLYERWDGYWQEGKPYLDRIEINIIADPMVQLASFLAGENDILTQLNPTDAFNIKDNPGMDVVISPTEGFTYGLISDSSNPDSPFSDLLVRQAMSYAIDRQAIADSVFSGFGEVTYQTNGSANWSYNPDLAGYPYDPDKAMELLEEAGYGEGFSTVIWYKSEQLCTDLYTVIQADLAAVGITADLQPLSAGAYGEMYYAGGWIGGVFGAITSATPEPGDLGRWFWDIDSCLPAFAFCAIHPDEVNLTSKQLNAATDFESKQALAWELQSLLFDKYCLQTVVILLPIMVAKSSKLRDEYSGTERIEPHTFADAWIEE